MAYVNSASFDVLVNGEASKFFRSGRGLRRGYLLSPLLFIMVMESLSILLKSSQSQGSIKGIKVSRITNIFHILFIDDIILMTNGSVQEWIEIKRIVQCFCSVTGLVVNLSKSTVHHVGLSEMEISALKLIFPYNFSDLSAGFKYLGYFLKEGLQKSSEWNWIITKVEKKIKHWSFHWLSLGGRFVLCKTVLEILPFY